MPPRQQAQGEDSFHVPEDMQKVADNQPTLPTILGSANHFMRQNIPPLTSQEIQNLLPSAETDDDWTQQDEEALQQAWNADPLKKHHVEPKGNKHMAPLWRYTIRFMGTTVEEIIGPRFNLACDISSNTVLDMGDRQVRNPHWSSKFCEKLLHIASHPMWLSQPGAMAMCLQYVVKCRTNDQRQMSWPRENYTDHKFVDIFQTVSGTFQNGTTNVRQLHDEVARRMNGIPSPYSRLFRTIEDKALKLEVGPLRAQGSAGSDVGIYTVSTSDLSTLIEALNSQVDTHGLPIHRQAAYTAVAAKAAKKSYDLPRDKDMETAREKAILGVRRYEAKAAKIAARQPPPQPQLGQDSSVIPAAAGGDKAMSHIGTQTMEPWPVQSEQPELDSFGRVPSNRSSPAGCNPPPSAREDESVEMGDHEDYDPEGYEHPPPSEPVIPGLDMAGLTNLQVNAPIQQLTRPFHVVYASVAMILTAGNRTC
ncbi:hypothetical protein F4811DRAFT_498762 [Daldinia bambusicola]|nr:hypothetical protein F4811DRAFT_498762 [Daldinia bambusicola]